MRISRTSTTVLRAPKGKVKVNRTEIVCLIVNLKSASRSRTPLPRKILASTIPRRNTLVRAATTAMSAVDRISAAIGVAIAAAVDAGVGAADAAAVDGRQGGA